MIVMPSLAHGNNSNGDIFNRIDFSASYKRRREKLKLKDKKNCAITSRCQ